MTENEGATTMTNEEHHIRIRNRILTLVRDFREYAVTAGEEAIITAIAAVMAEECRPHRDGLPGTQPDPRTIHPASEPPTSGRHVLILLGGAWDIGYHGGLRWYLKERPDEPYTEVHPTHWMELPPPPETP